MKVFITGATGFVGSYVVGDALAAGHEVRALVRPASRNPLASIAGHPRLSLVRADLRDRSTLGGALRDVDAVIHLAAAKSGDFSTQFAGTVLTTENLLTAMADSSAKRLVAVSTFSVYDYTHLSPGSVLDESSPIEQTAARRDEYARTKLIQERLYRDASSEFDVVILRPGMIYGRDNLWHSLLGSPLGPLFLKVGGRSVLPMTYVENCAQAITLALTSADAVGKVLNIVDDNLPTQEQYIRALGARYDVPASITVPWPVLRFFAHIASYVNARLLSGRAKFPGIVVPERLDARFKPFVYPNHAAKQALNWRPVYSLAESFARSVSDVDLIAERAFSAPAEAGTSAA
ncbi:NAD-dependent epimerase/dehydratase family protein [Micropruina sp.]|uniref:NAD-dependent epimerase/dehydratase family protein n=1 Tax=Micropruina sp. TaxID=2737536 RepID=UPI0039E366B1